MKVSSLPNKKIKKEVLFDLYINKKYSSARISHIFYCSQNKINYWLEKYEIQKRTISDAIYELKNPNGDPFSFNKPKNLSQIFLFGLGLGLYWGEGLKRGKGAVRLTNTDPKMIKKFIEFLEKVFVIDRNRLRFSIQIFQDLSSKEALEYWSKELKIKKSQFYKVIVSKVRGQGTYKYKSEHGVVIVCFNNMKLKRIILEMIEKIS